MKILILLFCLATSLQLEASPTVKPGSVFYGMVPCLEGYNCLKDSTKRLDFLHQQGVDVIWISPIFASDDESIISYKVTDYFAVNNSFGSSDDFKKFVARAHQLGMKVIMDFVPNHTSDQHPYVLDSERRGVRSKYYNFYDRNEDGEISTYEMWPDLYLLNYRTTAVQQMMIKAFTHWVQVYDVDGFRIDAAWGLKERYPLEFSHVISEVNKSKKELIWLAEAGALDPYYQNMGYQLSYDWSENLGEWAWEKAFSKSGVNINLLHQAIEKSTRSTTSVLRFINNNDTGDRFHTKYSAEITPLAIALQFTVPGYPMVYIGDMSAADFDPYDDPEVLDQSDRKGLFALYQKLAQLKEQLPALQSGELMRVDVTAQVPIYAFLRKNKGHNPVLVVLNFGATKRTLSLANPLRGSHFRNATEKLSSSPIKRDLFLKNQITLELEAYEAKIIEAH